MPNNLYLHGGHIRDWEIIHLPRSSWMRDIFQDKEKVQGIWFDERRVGVTIFPPLLVRSRTLLSKPLLSGCEGHLRSFHWCRQSQGGTESVDLSAFCFPSVSLVWAAKQAWRNGFLAVHLFPVRGSISGALKPYGSYGWVGFWGVKTKNNTVLRHSRRLIEPKAARKRQPVYTVCGVFHLVMFTVSRFECFAINQARLLSSFWLIARQIRIQCPKIVSYLEGWSWQILMDVVMSMWWCQRLGIRTLS